MGTCLAARNNQPGHKDDSLYDTSLDAETIVEGNTFLAGPMTQDAVLIVPNYLGRPHGPARFRRNVVVGPVSAPPNFRYEANAWKPTPVAALRSAGDVAVELINAAAAETLRNEYPAVGHNLRPGDFLPVAGSVQARERIGWQGTAVVEPPPPPPPDPEPTPVDWAALRGLAAELLTAARTVDAAARALQTLENRMREYELAAVGGEE
jgi:hypothetical protein